MQKINSKTCTKATVYKTWLDGIAGNHPAYTNTTHRKKFYLDIKANLICCQKGLCAYTEIRLDDEAYFEDVAVWKAGKYVGNNRIKGQLDHYNFKHKTNKGWKWENFFLVDGDINNVKGDEPIYYFMKPDSANYSPDKYLDYDIVLHEFIVSPKVTDPLLRDKIDYMINKVLFLNHGSIQRIRRQFLGEVFFDYLMGEKTKNQLRATQFPTAFAIMKAKLP